MRGPVGVRGPHGAGRMPRRRGAAAVRTVPAAQRAEGGPRTPGAALAAEAQRPVAAWRSPTARVGPAAPWVPTAGRSMGPSPVDPGRWARPRAAGAGRAVPSPSPAVGGTGPMAAVPRLRVAPAPESPGHGRVTRPGSRAPEPDHHGGTAPPGALRVSEGSNPASRGVSQPVDLRPPAGLRPRRGADLAPPPRPAPPKPSPRGRHPQQLTLRSRTREEARPGRSCRRGSPPALVFPTWEVPGRTDRPRPGSEGRDPRWRGRHPSVQGTGGRQSRGLVIGQDVAHLGPRGSLQRSASGVARHLRDRRGVHVGWGAGDGGCTVLRRGREGGVSGRRGRVCDGLAGPRIDQGNLAGGADGATVIPLPAAGADKLVRHFERMMLPNPPAVSLRHSGVTGRDGYAGRWRRPAGDRAEPRG